LQGHLYIPNVLLVVALGYELEYDWLDLLDDLIFQQTDCDHVQVTDVLGKLGLTAADSFEDIIDDELLDLEVRIDYCGQEYHVLIKLLA
jgi:hypothetical protein